MGEGSWDYFHRKRKEYVEWREFKVGERVRIKLSGECVYPPGTLYPGSPLTERHPGEADGVTGTLSDIEPLVPSHPYCVHYDTPLSNNGGFLRGKPYVPACKPTFSSGLYSAAELEPLDRHDR